MLIFLGLLAGLLLALAALFVRNLQPVVPAAPPPWANSLLVEAYAGAELSPWQFIAQNENTARNRFVPTFAQQPDMSLYSQEQNVFILLTNEQGETQTIVSVLRIVEDGVPPVFSGIRDEIHVGRGSTVAFRTGITVYHSSGQATFEVDSSAVDTSTPGIYEVVFIARTPLGQESRATSRVVVSASSEEQALALVQPILDQHIRPGMTQAEKARAIFDWTRWNIQYAVGGTHGDVLESVVQGMTRRRGDCYVFYAVSRFMLEQVGIEFVSLRRYPIDTARHAWLLVNVGNGWHHFDSTPNERDLPNGGFMFTQAQAQHFNNTQRRGFFSFDSATLPEGVVIQ
ncbi:MAG: transglutaminase-like domain-containing protein [Oscillospiraceae bacterium]|nr:transglutaminase-like domain-containing protein [Oscillospiraceae bacterium]